MSGVPARKRATYQDLCAVPEHLVAQIIDGELHVQPRPASPHARAASQIGGSLLGPFDAGRGGPGGWVILFEPELHLREDVLVPDLAGWRRERMPEMPEVPFFTLAPDWICEVLSPGTAYVDLKKKRRIYARERVEYLWLVDPMERSLDVLRLREASWIEIGTFEGDAEVHAAPFEAVAFDLGLLWRR